MLRSEDNAYGFFGIVSSAKSDNPCCVSADEIKSGAKKAVVFYGARFLLIQKDVVDKIKYDLPQSFIPCQKLSGNRDCYVYLTAAAESFIKLHKGFSVELGTYRSRTDCITLNEIYEVWQRDLREHSWAKQITWRLCRIQELFQQKGDKTVKAYKQDIERRLPKNKVLQESVRSYIAGLVGIALPSVLQLLQIGVDEDAVMSYQKKKTTLQTGFRPNEAEERHVMLTYQHRMHPDISAFSAKAVYHGEALKDGSEMHEKREWKCQLFGHHALWIDVHPNEYCYKENHAEIMAIKRSVEGFMKWAKANPKTDKAGKSEKWSIAILTYYIRQDTLLKRELKALFGEQREKATYENGEVVLMIYTVDKFQGREADAVYLSLVKSGEVGLGFMNSMNRLNVALTRARYQRVIVGDRGYFRRNEKSELLRLLAEESEYVALDNRGLR